MKKLLFVALLSLPLFLFSQTDFNKGYEKGYKEGYCYEDFGCIPPNTPIPPIPNIGYDSYQDGYNRGFSDGKSKKSGNSSSGSTSTGRRQIVTDNLNYEAIGAASSSGNQPLNTDAFTKSFEKAAKARAEREALKGDSESVISIDKLSGNIENYSTIAVVDVLLSNGKRTKGGFNRVAKQLETSPLKVINAADDKESFKSNKLYLRSNNNPKWLKLSYEAYYEGVDLHVKVNVRDYKNQILYQRKVVNVSWSRVLRDIANIYY